MGCFVQALLCVSWLMVQDSCDVKANVCLPSFKRMCFRMWCFSFICLLKPSRPMHHTSQATESYSHCPFDKEQGGREPHKLPRAISSLYPLKFMLDSQQGHGCRTGPPFP
ncbi:hypothetical protein B0H67DRAFT_583962 [Lasiosphaeris hirsuta]|uniref:Secreted protein n=1 Tax=Lasiosphaeris hirsuta TaxID=260670 RepID=A0AA40DRR9_9PEZI|nr:hypothetical protein B0H67DRAFT_583962 [Lasiosphaeris hirsuta]